MQQRLGGANGMYGKFKLAQLNGYEKNTASISPVPVNLSAAIYEDAGIDLSARDYPLEIHLISDHLNRHNESSESNPFLG